MKRNLQCDFCYRRCTITEGGSGWCGTRTVERGALVSTNWAKAVSLANDPVEKKPLYHFYPAHRTLSIALFGCNFSCSFCQNYSISQQEFQRTRATQEIEPEALIRMAQEQNCDSVSFTYSEPIVWLDYVLAAAALAQEAGLYTIMVTNGSFSDTSLERTLPLIDAFNVDLKGDEEFYRRVCSSSAEAPLSAIKRIAESDSHLEVTTMVNEASHTPAMLALLTEQLIERKVSVWHLSRYFPNYRSHDRATSEAYIDQATADALAAGIPFVYPGNSSLDTSSRCPVCATLLIERRYGRFIRCTSKFQTGVCTECGTGLWGRFPD